MSLIQFLYSVPTPVLVFLVVGLSAFLAVCGLLWTRRLVPFSNLQENNEFQDFLFGGIGIFYAVLLAFVVFEAWDQWQGTKDIVEGEANKVGDLLRNAEGYPNPFQTQIQTEVRDYAQAVVDEWDQTARGKLGMREQDSFDRLWVDFQSFEPRTEREKALFAEGLRHLSEIREQRRLRLLRTDEAVPDILWFVMLVGAVFTVCSTYFLGMRNLRAQVALTAIQASTIALILLVVFLFDHPFLGDVRVTPKAHEVQIQEAQRFIER